jgi:hypothetical protein
MTEKEQVAILIEFIERNIISMSQEMNTLIEALNELRKVCDEARKD